MSVRRKLIRGTSVQMDEEEEDDLQDGQAESAALPKMRAKRRRETKSKEMSEEEMMDLALRLSEQEASATELRQQEEEEAMMKAIQQSMFDQTQPFQTAFSSGSPHLLSRRKLSFPNGEKLFRGSPAGLDSGCSPEPFSEKTEEIRKKRLKKSGSHLPEMLDLSQAERTDSEASADSCNPPPAPLDSPQSSDSTRIDESEPQESPVFPLTGCRAVVHVDRLSEEVVDSCRHSGFVSSSQDTWSWTQKSTWTRSPTFPQSNPKTPGSPTAGPELVSSSQESPTPPLSCRSPVFLRSPSEILSTAASQQRSPPHMQTPGRDDQNCRQLPAVAEEQRNASCSYTPPGSNMMLVWSDEDDVTLLRSPSPVFPKERRLYGTEAPAASMDNAAPNHSSSDQHSSSTSAPACRKEPATSTEEVLRPACRETPGGQTVHYFWGIPFCPLGLDPDAYTQVIEAQMEVYEKSLKQAQRRLPRKAEWAEPILPEPEKASSPETAAGSPRLRASQRPGLMLRRGRTTEEHPDQEEEEQHQEEEQKDADICPETQLSGEDGAGGRSLPTEPPFPGCPEPPEVQVILQDDHSDGSAQTVDRGPASPGGVEVTEAGDPTSEAAVVPGSPPTSVDCPICQLSFPAGDIEMHAAFCNGGVADDGTSLSGFQESPKPRRQRARRAEAAESSQPSDACRILEKCFICQSAIPLREYSHHTELCIRRRRSKLAAKGNLLSALQDTESRSADLQASGSKVQPDDVIDLRNDDPDASRVTDSPIRTLTPISEVTDCLVDFKKQNRAKKPSQRRR
ncbi:BRCA1-A complex subunit RAP80 isoform X1 [Oryzias latipes]|uniref:Ubiquitin interaction motif-containing protein 1 n=1 Tax=Oryzias latipes TaxID=8090 RepID=A0A3B3I9B2_ORYLA|nr:BRCA1-A complex subunit RAP80 isoform X1 [Oryzias latipes]XP_023818685.1 BRCA1-A complex subunit RAP80 isoform X1 [Oryzias latipes]